MVWVYWLLYRQLFTRHRNNWLRTGKPILYLYCQYLIGLFGPMQNQTNHIDELEKMVFSLKRAIMLKETVSSHYASFKNQEITLLLEINKISSPLDWSQIAILQERLAALDSTSRSALQFTQKCFIKLYTQIMVVCILEENALQGSIFLQKLMGRIKTKRDLTDALQFLFRIRSLNLLVNYSIDQNKEYKYEPVTQALFFFILSQINSSQQTQLLGKSTSICERLKLSENNSPQAAKIANHSKNKNKSTILQILVMRLLNRERSFIVEVANVNDEGKNVKQLMAAFCNQKWSLNNDNQDEEIGLSYAKRQKLLLNIFQLTNGEENELVLQHLQNTSLIRKITASVQNKSKPQSFRIRRPSYNSLREAQLLQGQTFKSCQQGMTLLKCNYSNGDIRPRFVCLSNEGICWGTQKQDCVLKHTVGQFRAILYGKVTPNLLIKAKAWKSSNMFSIQLENRSIDFVCQNYQQIVVWLRALAYMISQLQKKQDHRIVPSVLTRGQILWKSLMMNLRRGGQIGVGKARGITSLKDQVHLKSLDILMHQN